MVKHNNVLPNVHFHKNWQIRVKTWFDQPAKKKARRVARAIKAHRRFPRPASGPLRPIVRCQTARYNNRLRVGRGFTPRELKEAGLVASRARNIGLAVDYRRKNRSEAGLQANVQRIKEYKSKLVIIPRKARTVKRGEPRPEKVIAPSTNNIPRDILPIVQPGKVVEFRPITEEDKSVKAYARVRRARIAAARVGIKKKMAAKKAAKKALGDKK